MEYPFCVVNVSQEGVNVTIGVSLCQKGQKA